MLSRQTTPLRLVLLVALTACAQDLSLPSAPDATVVPTITDFFPKQAFMGEIIQVVGTGFDPDPQNNIIQFEEGHTTQALVRPGSDSEHLFFQSPKELRVDARFSVHNRFAASALTGEVYSPLGNGRPILGTGVTELKFRHRPVGLVNIAARILVASTLFPAVVDDAGRFRWIGAASRAFARAPHERGLLSTQGDDGGHLLEIDVASGDVVAQSAASPIVDGFVLPLPETSEAVARTVGHDALGRTSLTTWKRAGSVLEGTRVALDIDEVIGAAQLGELVVVLGSVFESGHPQQVLVKVAPDGKLTELWRGVSGEDTAVAAGPVAVVDTTDGPRVVLGLADGDLASVNPAGTPWVRTRMISFAPATALAPALAAGRVLVTKKADGAIFQFDPLAGSFDWTVQLRGAPTAIDVSADLQEIAVANDDDNAVDVISASDGTWKGRSSLSLGLGSADGGDGGAVPAYGYIPAYDGEYSIRLLARTAPLVIDLDPNALSVNDVRQLDPDASAPVRLVQMPDFRTLVVHEHDFGVITTDGEDIVATDVPSPALSVSFLRDGRLVAATRSSLDLYAWSADQKKLEPQGSLALPAHAFVVGAVSHLARYAGDREHFDGGIDSFFALWRSPAGWGGGYYDLEHFAAGATPSKPVAIDATYADPTGVFDLADGPAVTFARSPLGYPALLPSDALHGEPEAKPLRALTDAPLITATTADRRYVIWVNKGSGENALRVLAYMRPDRDLTLTYEPGFISYDGYRLPGEAAGPCNDPSGEWLYVPVPRLDMLSVLQ